VPQKTPIWAHVDGTQLPTQVPFWHVWPVGQMTPAHGSATHMPFRHTWPFTQSLLLEQLVELEPQAPLLQYSLPRQALKQLPQFEASVRRLTQIVPQRCRPDGQPTATQVGVPVLVLQVIPDWQA
jgi:hypothetical protein